MSEILSAPSSLSLLDIPALEKALLALPQAECEVFHFFAPGLYVRGVNLPAGIIAIGHAQKNPHLNVMVKGKVVMVNDDKTTSVVTAPQIYVGQPGKKTGYILENTLWLNIYATDETDVSKIEDEFLEKSETFAQAAAGKSEKDALLHEASRTDFAKLLTEYGFTAEEARKQAENQTDQIPMPDGTRPTFTLRQSPIEGKGIFASAHFYPGDIIGVARIGDKRTPLGRYTNHSICPNAEFIKLNDDIYLQAIADIPGSLGGSHGTEITVNYRQALDLVGAKKI